MYLITPICRGTVIPIRLLTPPPLVSFLSISLSNQHSILLFNSILSRTNFCILFKFFFTLVSFLPSSTIRSKNDVLYFNSRSTHLVPSSPHSILILNFPNSRPSPDPSLHEEIRSNPVSYKLLGTRYDDDDPLIENGDKGRLSTMRVTRDKRAGRGEDRPRKETRWLRL